MRILLLGFRWGLLITPALMMMATLVISALSVHNHDDHDFECYGQCRQPEPHWRRNSVQKNQSTEAIGH